MAKAKLKPPKQTRSGHATEIAQAGIGSIPIVGGIATGVLNSVFPSELEKRRANWEAEVTDVLNNLDFENLANDEAFISILVLATESARRTHKREKIKRLGNTLRNYHLVKDYDIKQKFLQWIDEFTDFEFIIFDTITSHPDVSAQEILSKIFSDDIALQTSVMENLLTNKCLVSYGRSQQSPPIKTLILTDIGEKFWQFCS